MEEKRQEHVIDFAEVSPGWQLCFCEGCPRHEECLRYVAGQQIPDKLHWGPAVYPTSWKSGECEFFREARILRLAWGFDLLYREVKQKDYTMLLDKVKGYLGGHGTYYRYNRGEKLLTPEQQEWIINLFHRYGYTEGIEFVHYRDAYDFG